MAEYRQGVRDKRVEERKAKKAEADKRRENESVYGVKYHEKKPKKTVYGGGGLYRLLSGDEERFCREYVSYLGELGEEDYGFREDHALEVLKRCGLSSKDLIHYRDSKEVWQAVDVLSAGGVLESDLEVSRAGLTKWLERALQLAEKGKSPGMMVSAIKELAALHGLHAPQKTEVKGAVKVDAKWQVEFVAADVAGDGAKVIDGKVEAG